LPPADEPSSKGGFYFTGGFMKTVTLPKEEYDKMEKELSEFKSGKTVHIFINYRDGFINHKEPIEMFSRYEDINEIIKEYQEKYNKPRQSAKVLHRRLNDIEYKLRRMSLLGIIRFKLKLNKSNFLWEVL
jgi:hypothetical protein